jgi:hypothetical protein
MDQEIRNKLRNVVTQCRKLLEDSVSQELEGKYGIFAKKEQVTADPNSKMTHLAEEEQAARKDILDHLGHIKARGFKPKDALDQLVREIAFTHLNRLCAYKMMEAREVYVGGQKFREAVSRGINSNGVKFYLADHPDEERLFNTGHQDVAYRHFLDWLGGLLSDEIGVLFNPNDPANRLYPRQKTLDEVLELLNYGGIKPEESELRDSWPEIWSQDETIGWVYQYFTPKELRDQARKESSAPRNSYELAFRNQFFTPRYVVEFLTDNTLGRIWYEMRKGETKLTDQCRYMVSRPTEMFLQDGEQPPKDASEGRGDLSQEELLKLPVHIPHRPKKDPRELKILDPACGSGHFLLYCFDLLLTIYEEAYADPDLGPALKKDYPTLDALKRDLPRLILAHNLHGIDIDMRASQIAALALWLRCQRAYQDMGLKKDRPKITRSNFVCAEPMPGEEQMLTEFVSQLEPKLLGQVVEVVFDKMKLAGEAGSLLKIEEEIRDAVAAAKKQYVRETTQATDRKGQPLLFTQAAMDRLTGMPEQQSLFDLSDITENQFFEQAEARVIDALRWYAEKAQHGQKLSKRLFTDDAVRGFAFVDLCHKRYDVVLMNPPFGDPPRSIYGMLESSYSAGKTDLAASFVSRATILCPAGYIGAITTRIPLFTIVYQEWRTEVFLRNGHLKLMADLGGGVLDTAMVEAAAYCIGTAHPVSRVQTAFIPAYSTDSPSDCLLSHDLWTLRDLSTLNTIPGFPLAYWLPDELTEIFAHTDPFEPSNGVVRQGLGTTDDFRFCRLRYEVSVDALCSYGSRSEHTFSTCWVPYVKGDSFSPYFEDYPLVVNWTSNGEAVKEFNRERYGSASRNVKSESFYGRVGLVFPRRTKRFCPRLYPQGMIFSVGGQSIFPVSDPLAALGYMSTAIASSLVKAMLGRIDIDPQFEAGVVKRLPFPSLAGHERQLRTHVEAIIQSILTVLTLDETSAYFVFPWPHNCPTSLMEMSEAVQQVVKAQTQVITTEHQENESIVAEVLGLSDAAIAYADQDFSVERADFRGVGEISETCKRVISYAVGVMYGRWDVRLALVENIRATPALPVNYPGLPEGQLQSPTNRLGTDSESYPFAFEGNGVVVDDDGHQSDLVRRTRAVIELIWKDRADSFEREACDVLGVKELRDYFRRSGKGGFWDDHVSRYSKSRRKAPIYWLLQSSKKNYAVWLYYHRLDKDILFKALVNYVEPKIRMETSRHETLRSQKNAAGESGKEAKRLAKEVEKQEDFLSELMDFEDKLRRAANLHLEPDLNDGVVLNIAPLHELVPWKEAEKYWKELLAGEYEWSSIGKQLRQKGLVK